MPGPTKNTDILLNQAVSSIPRNIPALATTWDPVNILDPATSTASHYLASDAGAGAGAACGRFTAIGSYEFIGGVVAGVSRENGGPYTNGGIAIHNGTNVYEAGRHSDVVFVSGATYSYTTGYRSGFHSYSQDGLGMTGPVHVAWRKDGSNWTWGWSMDGVAWRWSTLALAITPTHYGVVLAADGPKGAVWVTHLLACASAAEYAAAIPTAFGG